MLEKCPECGEDLKGNSIVVWKCNNCNKSFKGSSQFLQNLQRKKDDNPGKNLLKCNNCGSWLDDGKEDISVKCSSCGNMIKGNLEYLNKRKNLIKCPECGRENVSNTAISCPGCGFAIKEFFNKKLNKIENSQQIYIESEIIKIRTHLDEFYVREGAYWYNKNRSTYNFFNSNGYMTDDEAVQCNNPGLGYYEYLNYLEKAIIEIYNKCQETTQGIVQYNEFIRVLFKILSFEKYNCLLSLGSKMDLYNTFHIEILERDTILEVAKWNATGNYTIWSAGELNILFKGLNEADKNLCVSYFGQKYNPQLTNDVDIEGLYQKWLEYKNQNKEFDTNLIDLFKGKKSTIKMPLQAVASIYEEPKSSKSNNENRHIPKCPICGSPNIKKISGISKAGSIALWGIFSQKIHKQWHCNNCSSEW